MQDLHIDSYPRESPIRNNWNLKKATLDEILHGKVDFPYGEHRPLAYYKDYIKTGCYPYFGENELPQYLEYLEKAELVSVLRMKANGDAILRKMDKLYLHNPNMMHTLVGGNPKLIIKRNIPGLSGDGYSNAPPMKSLT